MRLADDPEAARWLEDLAGGPEDFEWDPGNRDKNRKHGVEAGDIESILAGPILFAGRIVEPAHPEPRWLVLGQDRGGRRLALIFTRRGNRLRPVARDRCDARSERSMKKRSTTKAKKTKARDAQVEEFDRRDLGADIRAAGTGRILRGRTKPTSILLEEELVAALRKKGAKRGLGYQTMLKLIVREHLDEY
jgi:uncharacterized DUF497 family protein